MKITDKSDFVIVAGEGNITEGKEIAEIRFCDRIRQPGIFGNLKKRIFPGIHQQESACVYIKERDEFKACIDWAKTWVKYGDRIVVIRKTYLGGYVL